MDVLKLDTVVLSEDRTTLDIVDQTKLPGKVEILHLSDCKDIWDAIYHLKVRGAPAIGVAAAFGIYLASKQIKADDAADFYRQFKQKKEYLASARPTAVNLFWALDRMERVVAANLSQPVEQIWARLYEESQKIYEEDIAICRAIGAHGAPLIRPGNGILTHCNAGTLATAKYGTALSPIYVAMEQGVEGLRVFCDETRPLLQGARLSAFELQSAGVNTTLICDNMASIVMKQGKIDLIFVGCDRVARNGDAANKIGTSGVAILAHYYGIPFYVCAPTSTIDLATETGADIVIEERPAYEVTEMWYRERMAPQGVGVYNPAFDVTDRSLITGIITEKGIAYPPYEASFRKLGILVDEKGGR